jgi:glycosyltransferase involved in cell wall biosynthesis
MSDPLVSVVVPTHNRPARLARLLASLRAQSLASDAFEVVVVDDGSEPATAEVIAREAAAPGPPLRAIRHRSPRGPGAARNSGWRQSRAPVIAFTDDDCVADQDWLRSGLAACQREPGSIVQGRTEPDPSELSGSGMFSRTLQVSDLGPLYETCNIFYPREVLASLGGFDERFGLAPGGEDTDLAWRAIEHGHSTTFAPDAVVLHAVDQLGVWGTLRVAARWSATIRVYADYPQTRTMLYRGVFWNVWHYLLLRSAAALLAPRWLRRQLLMRYLLALQERARLHGAGATAVPFLIVHDVVESWAVLRGAWRHRTFVL